MQPPHTSLLAFEPINQARKLRGEQGNQNEGMAWHPTVEVCSSQATHLAWKDFVFVLHSYLLHKGNAHKCTYP